MPYMECLGIVNFHAACGKKQSLCSCFKHQAFRKDVVRPGLDALLWMAWSLGIPWMTIVHHCLNTKWVVPSISTIISMSVPLPLCPMPPKISRTVTMIVNDKEGLSCLSWYMEGPAGFYHKLLHAG